MSCYSIGYVFIYESYSKIYEDYINHKYCNSAFYVLKHYHYFSMIIGSYNIIDYEYMFFYLVNNDYNVLLC